MLKIVMQDLKGGRENTEITFLFYSKCFTFFNDNYLFTRSRERIC